MAGIKSVEELRNKAKEIVGIPFSKIDKNGRLSTGKGAIGTTIEESWFGQKPHSDENPDFAEFGIELKVTPYLKNEKFVSKERLVCNMINFMNEATYLSFEESSFYKKCNSILLLFYQHLLKKPKGDFSISHARFITLSRAMKENFDFFFLLPSEDVEIMRQDWKKIVSKIKAGKAHEISEGDTNYLGACTKSSDSSKRVKQPFSNIEAKPRAFSIKQSYMTFVLNNYVIKKESNERLINDSEDLKIKTFEEVIIDKLRPYFGKSDIDLAAMFNIDTNNKSFRDRIVASILGIKGSINKSEEFLKASITSKTIRIEKNGTLKESMSFPAIKFAELIESEWEESDFYNQIGLSRFMFSVFKRIDSTYILEKVFFWNMPEQDLNESKKVWEKTKELVKNNKLKIGGKYGFSVENFPQSSQNPVSHVRPHDIDSKKGRSLLPDGTQIIKYCFWLNRNYIKRIVTSDYDSNMIQQFSKPNLEENIILLLLETKKRGDKAYISTIRRILEGNEMSEVANKYENSRFYRKFPNIDTEQLNNVLDQLCSEGIIKQKLGYNSQPYFTVRSGYRSIIKDREKKQIEDLLTTEVLK